MGPPARGTLNMDQVTYHLDGDIAVATVNRPPVNTLGLAVRRGLLTAIERSLHDAGVKALVIIGGGTTFVAGADINDFGKPYEAPSLYAIMDAIMASSKPVLAAIHGTALGGGLELALACQWRIAVPDALIGQPEVKLGLMPGGGGTQWWTRLAGPEIALEVCTSGEPIDTRRAHACGVIDRIVEGDLLAGALAFAREIASGAVAPRRLADAADKIGQVDARLFVAYRNAHRERWRGLLAPWKIIDCIEAACSLSFAEGYALERQAFQECEHGPHSRAMIHLFFAERAARKLHKAAGTAGLPNRQLMQSLRQAIRRESAFLIADGVAPHALARALSEFGFVPAQAGMAGGPVAGTGASPHAAPGQDILQRLLCALVNEGARCLEQKLAVSAGEIDVASVSGLGFPSHRGGPMYWAQEADLQAVRDFIVRLHALHGERWRPSAVLDAAAQAGGRWDLQIGRS